LIIVQNFHALLCTNMSDHFLFFLLKVIDASRLLSKKLIFAKLFI
jgi:hypothetical protein